MLWLCLYMPQLPLQCRYPRLQGPACSSGVPSAVVESVGTRRLLVACDDLCARYGIARGLDATSALARYPGLQLLPRSKREELAGLEALAGWATQFSSSISFDARRFLLWLEIGASLNYFGGVNPLLQRVQGGLAALEYNATLGVAPTLEAAALLARLGGQSPVSRKDLYRRLAVLPVKVLALAETTIGALHASGLTVIGQVLVIPASTMARRFGQDSVEYLRRLVGESPDIRIPYQAPKVYRRQMDLPGRVESTEALLFPLRRLFLELEGFLRGCDAAIHTLKIYFQHEDGAHTKLTLHASHPLRRASRLYDLLNARLEHCVLAAPTSEIHVEARELVAIEDTQLSLLNNKSQFDGWPVLLDKFRARLGDGVVRQLGLRDDHRPERAWYVRRDSVASSIRKPFADRPLWLTEPCPLSGQMEVLGDMERIEAGWWDGHDVARDYYQAQTSSGGRMWVYLDHKDQRWYLHGFWA